MITGLAVPYMGSKRKLAPQILNHIIQQNPNCKYIYDLFGGGGAVSFMALQYPQIKTVFYNELNTGVCELLRKIQKNGVTDDFYQWIDRETFNKHKNDNTWFSGLVKTCWSFGNNQKCYLFGKEVEEIKREAHFYLFANGYNKTVATRVALIKQFKQDKNIIGEFEVERLQSLESLERLESLEISNLSYEQVKITTPISETVIYLDPPYKSTVKYQHDINHNYLLEWIKASPYKIYLSSYEFYGLYECHSMQHRSTLSSTANNRVEEKLFCNYDEDKQEQQLMLF
jgi:site-specific DNA-adenine methylase